MFSRILRRETERDKSRKDIKSEIEREKLSERNREREIEREKSRERNREREIEREKWRERNQREKSRGRNVVRNLERYSKKERETERDRKGYRLLLTPINTTTKSIIYMYIVLPFRKFSENEETNLIFRNEFFTRASATKSYARQGFAGRMCLTK